jgi:hypothetical protein
MDQWNQYYDEVNEPYPDTNFMPPDDLFVYDGCSAPPNYPDINDAGLVMAWGPNDEAADGNSASAWQAKYGPDPDLTNCLIPRRSRRLLRFRLGFKTVRRRLTRLVLSGRGSGTAARQEVVHQLPGTFPRR